MPRTLPEAVCALTAAAIALAPVITPVAPAVQAQSAPGGVSTRSCAVGTDTLSALGVASSGSVTVSDGTTARRRGWCRMRRPTPFRRS